MDRIVEEMSKVRSDVEKRMRRRIAEIIEECGRFSYLGRMFTFDYDDELSRKINGILISLSDDIMEDIESRAKAAISEAGEEEDEDIILAYIKREINGEDLTARLDRHNSALRYFLEGWIAIGFAESISRQSLLSDIFAYMDNPFASPRWQSAFGKGYASSAIRSYGYTFGKGNQRNVLNALSLAGEYAINESFQYGRIMRYGKDGAIGYRTHRGSTFDCPYCDELTKTVHPLTDIVLPAHPRCVCYSTPVYADGKGLPDNVGLTYYNKRSGGMLITSNQRKAAASVSKNEAEKFSKEQAMCLILAQNGYTVEHLPEKPGISSSDILINGEAADLKKTSSANNIVKYAKKAVRQQGADLVIFEFENETKAIYAELEALKRLGIKAKYFFSNSGKVRDI